MKKGQPITARRVDEMGVRLPLEESPCPHRSSSSAFSVRASPLCSLLHSLSHHHCYHPRVAPHSISTSTPCSLPPLLATPDLYRLSLLSRRSLWIFSLSPSLSFSLFPVSPFSVAHTARHSRRQRREEIHFREKKSPRKIDANRLLAAWPLDRGCIGARGLAGVA